MITLWTTLLACGQGELSWSPSSLAWGEVEFHSDECMDCLCEGGCGPLELSLENVGDEVLNLEFPDGISEDRFCVTGFPDAGEAFTIPELGPGDSYLLEISVCGYTPGELTLEVSGEIAVWSDGALGGGLIPWSYTPLRTQ